MKSLAKIVLAAFTVGVVALPCYADSVTKTTTTVTTIRTDTPVYMGPVQEMELQELTLADFEFLAGSKPFIARQQFNEYQSQLEQPRPNPVLVPYKLTITDRDLTLADFQWANVSPELAQERYNKYLQINPTPIDGRARSWYVYRTPITWLTLYDFQWGNVSPELAQERYNEYLRINPMPIDGRVRYWHVYQAPMTWRIS